ncbi:MAG TPA: methionine--tRNA ligase [Polyangia bacterium]|nr:methionine--tRNA ligase [Polyangia bacterium]
MSRFYITTPIYYVNAVPHLGTFYSTVVDDALARYHRARHGKQNVFFLTGLDEHGQKIERIAREKGIEPQAYCDAIAEKFKATWARVGISNDDFIRTTEPRHKAAVAEMWKRLVAAGDIYEAEYDGMYCVGCESAKTEDDVDTENGQKVCKIHRTPVERVKEKNYFFRLSKYAPRLLEWYAQTPSPVLPESRRNEVRAFVESGLRDLSVSRQKKSVGWAIPVPDDPTQTIFVWIDALTNYLTVLGGPDAVARQQRNDDKAAFWAAANHMIAKDILRFHAVYWPAMLMSAGLPPPRQVFCHGYLTVRGQKISKSVPATKVDPNAIADELGVDPLRYFVLREYTLGADGDFTYEALFQRYESDLGNDLGNLLNRTISMVHKFVGAALPARPQQNDTAGRLLGQAQSAWEAFSPSGALEATWRLVRAYNQKIDEEKPWALHKEGKIDRLTDVLAGCCEALRWAALMVAPAMPVAAREILRQLGRAQDEGTWPAAWGWPGGTLAEPKPVFPRVEPERQAALIAKWVPADAAAAAAPAKTDGAAPASADIAFDDFQKLDLRAAKVTAAERVPKADKLLKLTLDVGGDQRTVVSGIAPAYAPEQMVGKTVIYLANLAPRKIRGVLSQGMILAAGGDEVLALSGLDRDVPPGTPIR